MLLLILEKTKPLVKRICPINDRVTSDFLDSIDRFLISRSIFEVLDLSKIFFNLSDEEIFQLKQFIESKLASRYVHQFKPTDLVRHSFSPGLYRKGVTQSQGLIDFLLDLRDKSSGSRVIFLGEDGYEYLGPAFHILTKGDIKYSSYPISRKDLATKAELIDLGKYLLTWPVKESPSVDDLLQGEDVVEILTKIKRDFLVVNDSSRYKIKLYQDVDSIIQVAIFELGMCESASCNSELIFADSLFQGFKLIISNNDHRNVCIKLISNLLSEINFDNSLPLIIVDYAGIRHVQAHLIQLTIRWLSDPKNWFYLSCSQKLLLRVDSNFFNRLNVFLHIGVSEGNPLYKIKSEEVFVNAPSIDLVETTRFWGPSDASLADGDLLIGIRNSFHISETLAKISIILEESYKIHNS